MKIGEVYKMSDDLKEFIKHKDTIKSIIITIVFVVASISFMNSSNDLVNEIEGHYDYINKESNTIDRIAREYDKLTLVKYNTLIQKFIISGIVFSITFILFILDIKNLSLTEKLEKWQANKK